MNYSQIKSIAKMYITVRLLNGLKHKLTYKAPNAWQQEDLVGQIVKVPLRNKIERAIIESQDYKISDVKYEIKEAIEIEKIPKDTKYISFLDTLSNYYCTDKIFFFKRIKNFLNQKPVKVIGIEESIELPQTQSHILTDEQINAINIISTGIEELKYWPTLLHGVTGSGKTEVYKEIIKKIISQNKSVILLLPEVSLVIQFTKILKASMQNITIHEFHSANSVKQKKEIWLDLTLGNPILIIGVHLPIMLPINNLGLIIIDEEHETGFQEKQHPKINSKEAALLRAQVYNIPIVLGSATPSISSIYNAKTKNWPIISMNKRFAGKFPEPVLVNLKELTDKRDNFWISKELEIAIHKQLKNKEQTIIFINRRGYSFFIQCKNCGIITTCEQCSVSLTLHSKNILICHYCAIKKSAPAICTSCNKTDFIKKGLGTEQVVEILQKIFPQARIARADMDSTVNKIEWKETINNFEDKKLDILVGTQTISKGYHFPNVTLVGILWADISLGFPIYNAAEKTLQQVIQVSGRAGRATLNSKVIIQTILDHEIFNYIDETKYLQFYDNEINKRILTQYPPYIRLAEIEIKNKNKEIIESESLKIATFLNTSIQTNNLAVILLGPAIPAVHTIKNTHIRKIYLKAKNINLLIKLFNSIDSAYNSSINFTPNPLS